MANNRLQKYAGYSRDKLQGYIVNVLPLSVWYTSHVCSLKTGIVTNLHFL